MKLNRALIKQQAKQLIKNNVLKLFAISIVVSLCVSLPSIIFSGLAETYMSLKSISMMDFDSPQQYDDADDLEDFFENYPDGNYYNNDFYNFGNQNGANNNEIPDNSDIYDMKTAVEMMGMLFTLIAIIFIGTVATFLLSPLSVSLSGLFVDFIRGKRFDTDEGVRVTFRESFKKGIYGKKLGITILRQILITLLSYLLLIPGIIFNYSSYFFAQLMCDYPELSPWDAIKLSKKIVKGNRTELFVLELSFIPWMLLCIFVFPIVYVLPYISTTQALYYENFRLRAIQEGRVTEDDFLSDRQKYEKYVSQRMGGGYGAPYGNPQQPMNNGAGYYNPQQPVNNGTPYGNPQQPMNNGAPYGNPQQPVNNGAGYYNPQQPVNNGAGYYNPQQPVNNGAPYGNPQQPANNGADYYNPQQPVNNGAEYYNPPVHNDEPQTAPTEEPVTDNSFDEPFAEYETAPVSKPEPEAAESDEHETESFDEHKAEPFDEHKTEQGEDGKDE